MVILELTTSPLSPLLAETLCSAAVDVEDETAGVFTSSLAAAETPGFSGVNLTTGLTVWVEELSTSGAEPGESFTVRLLP